MPEKLSVPSFAKINLGLRVLGKRTDGYHELFTVFQTISLCDELTFEISDRLELTCSDLLIPSGPENLIYRAAELLKAESGSVLGAKIFLEKRIPSPGGLGGGSSNAAVALMALNRLWGINASVADLHKLAERLGSDVPFFLLGGSAVGKGRGTELAPIDIDLDRSLIVVTPNISVPTGEAFNRLNSINLTTVDEERILLNCRFEAENVSLSQLSLDNDFERTVFERYPVIERVKLRLLELGASNAAMSGSGASVYGFFDNKETRQTALKALGEEPNWRSFAVAAVSRDEYRVALEEVF